MKGLRRFRRYPGLYWTCVLVLGLGISVAGASHAVLWSFLSPGVPHAEDVATIGLTSPQGGVAALPFTLYAALREECRSYAATVAFTSTSAAVALEPDREPTEQTVAGVSPGLVELLQTAPPLGRAFDEGDYASGATSVALLSHGLWRRAFAADPSVVGHMLRVGGEAVVVIGVLPRNFNLHPAVLLMPQRRVKPGGSVTLWVRRKPGVSWDSARAEATLIASRLTASGQPGPQVRLMTTADQLALRKAPLMMAFPLLVLLVACFNVGNLLLGHAIEREHEVGVRLALGATRARLAAQFLAEGAAVAVPAALAAGVFLHLELQLVRVLAAERMVWVADSLHVTATTWVFVATLAGLTPLVFSVAPLLHALRLEVIPALRRGSGGRRGGGLTTVKWRDVLTARYRARDLLVVLQVAGALGLVTTFAVIHGLLWELMHPSFGFEREGIVVLDTRAIATAKGVDPLRLLERVRTLPGVVKAATADHPSFPGYIRESASHTVAAGEDTLAQPARVVGVDESFFECLGVPVRGRGLGREEVASRLDVGLLSESLARRLWPGDGPPVGRVVDLRSRTGLQARLAVIGIAPDLAFFPHIPSSRHAVYVPLNHRVLPARTGYVLLRAARSDQPFLRAVNEVVAQEVGGAPPARAVRRHTDLTAGGSGDPLFVVRLLGLIGAVALALAVAGIVAVTRQVVRANVRDLAIRAALGASRAALIRLVLRHSLIKTAMGLAIGLPWPVLYWWRQEAGTISGVLGSPAVLGVLLAAVVAAVLGSYWPARAAGRLDPAALMREE